MNADKTLFVGPEALLHRDVTCVWSQARSLQMGPSLNQQMGPSLNQQMGASLNQQMGPSLNQQMGPSLNQQMGKAQISKWEQA